ncbi:MULTISPECIES: TonB-dependent receptor domain-containing protein [unclassified Arcicella]|uniref:TonB-dependent receptor family protein n=1 Tax=unclassified Arcicella TaxID=2644986 RepID=UPI00285DB0CF|nr:MULTISPECIES: TonB-dependent receptor [unclassified Arcicella]MDR6564687.1 Fe(3+) dicitrate transport protein [Arcicella sp. BE51]MDR6814483.1 Fe(3+) dicitrate transport protein [Arcicella sp. BE140]MDR6825930.1 Fe(3+) dicitrate transport protein [Arcicella sp. BE139]
MKHILLPFLLLPSLAFSQKTTIDSSKVKHLDEVEVKAFKRDENSLLPLNDVHNSYIFSGKKHEVISVQSLNANISEKTGRQIFAKVAGAFVYDMDGSGNQMNISTRGLDPHRSWEYNVRQNGIMTNSDIYGYPASHYSAPMESIQKIEIVRGTASLQYGAQFGGMINYVTKQADTTKKISFESINSVGSYGLFSSYNAIGGKVGKLKYYGYFQKRVSDGYRKNAQSDAQSQFLALEYEFSSKLKAKAEIGRSQYVFHIPGPLTDDMFYQDPRQSTRSRNYFSPDIVVPSLSFDWRINESTQLQWINSAVLGTRNSVQIVALANVPDAIDPATNQYKNRQVDIDHFNSYSSELRLTKYYNIGNFKNTLVGGLRYINNDLNRQQLGKGTTGSDYDLTLVDPAWGRDLHYKTQNVAVFVENIFYVTPKFNISPAFRLESGTTKMSGYIKYLASDKVPNEIKHSFPLFGVNSQYKINNNLKVYGGWSQAYRPVIFSDIIPPTALDVTDQNLKDASGYNAEIGIRGNHKQILHFDITYFQIQYDNRIGSLILPDASGNNFVYKTNVGSSLTKGLEVFVEAKPIRTKATEVSVFTATSYFDASYIKGSVTLSGENKSIVGNRLETVPRWISRNGVTVSHKIVSATLQYSYVADSYSDALNTEKPSADGSKGLVPSYGILDLNTSLKIAPSYTLKLGINNITNEQYFTKRPTGYPGVGVWSSDGRSIVATLQFKI